MDRLKNFRIGDTGNERGCQRRADAGKSDQSLRRFIRALPTKNAPIEDADLLVQRFELSAKRNQAPARRWRNTFIPALCNQLEEIIQALSPDRRDNACLDECGRIELLTAVRWRTNRCCSSHRRSICVTGGSRALTRTSYPVAARA